MIDDKAYESADLREQLDARGTKPVNAIRFERAMVVNYVARAIVIASSMEPLLLFRSQIHSTFLRAF
jgi:hypothetical protein